jgi:hypothetical protein
MSNPRNYGTAPGSTPEDGLGAGEQMPLLRKPSSDSRLARLRRFMAVDVKRERADIILVLCYLVTGLLDSASISIWGSFVSMQTGMIISHALHALFPHVSCRRLVSCP